MGLGPDVGLGLHGSGSSDTVGEQGAWGSDGAMGLLGGHGDGAVNASLLREGLIIVPGTLAVLGNGSRYVRVRFFQLMLGLTLSSQGIPRII